MDPIPKSGYKLANRLARTTLLALEGILGSSDFHKLLKLAQLPQLIDSLPSASLERGFDFADYAALTIGLEEMFGRRGGHGMALRAGRATFADAINHFDALASTGKKIFRLLPLRAKFRIALPALARIFNGISDQRTRLKTGEHEYHYIIHRNPVCWERKGEDKPVCHLHVGLLQEAMQHISGGYEFRVDEAECQAMNADACRFVLHKEPLN